MESCIPRKHVGQLATITYLKAIWVEANLQSHRREETQPPILLEQLNAYLLDIKERAK